MTKAITVEENLKKVRNKAHETMRKNGHFKKMAKIRWAKKSKKK